MMAQCEMPTEQQPLSKEGIHAIFKPLGDGNMAAFFDNVADDVDWTVKGIDSSLSQRLLRALY